MGLHYLKIWPRHFDDVDSGRKPFELRIDDRGYHVGDILHLREWDKITGEYTGRETQKRVTFILRDRPEWGLSPGHCIMALAAVE